MKSLRDEIRLRREIRTDLISSAKQISSEQSEDFIAPCAISLKNEQSCSIIQLDKLEFGKLFLKEYVGAAIGRPCSEILRIRIGLRRIQTMCWRTSNARPYNVNLRLFNRLEFDMEAIL